MTQRYDVLEKLGTGGMAEVHRAFDYVLGHEVALKRLRGDGAARTVAIAKALFEREYRVLSQLAHPRIIAVHDYAVDAQGPFYTMELLDGGDLRDRAPIPWKAACGYLRDAASSLAIIHSRGFVHRDVSPRNVRCTADGRAKLIDFGALAPMGVPAEVVGTPPLIAPEALNGQPLDARTDLYALGATAYFALTGLHAYPARSLRHLPRHWRTPPAPVQATAGDVPEALGALVSQLMSLDPQARPKNAMEVIEQLTSIGALEDDESASIQQAFLTTPALVQRDDQLAVIEEALDPEVDDRAATLVIEGGSGLGRSRLLGSAALRAQLAGYVVLRADAESAPPGDYGVVARLTEQLGNLVPSAREALTRHASKMMGATGTDRAAASPARPDEVARQRRDVLGGLRDWLVDVAMDKPLLIAVDDLELADEPSATLLALLAGSAQAHRVSVAVTVNTERPGNAAAVRVLRGASFPLSLAPLDREGVGALLGSVFGEETPNIEAVTERVHHETDGNPRGCVILAQHLVTRGLARYEQGGWRLPPGIATTDLPANLEEALRDRLTALSSDARRLAEALAMARGHLDPEDYAAAAGAIDLHRALDELAEARVLRTSSRGDALWPSSVGVVVEARMSEGDRRALHARLADVMQRRGAHPMRVAHHRFGAGHDDRATTLAHGFAKDLVAGKMQVDPAWLQLSRSVLEAALRYARRSGEAPAVLTEIRMALLVSSLSGSIELTFEHGPAVEERIRRDVGAVYWDELPVDASAEERARHGLSRANEVHDATPLAERGLSPFEALYALGRYVMYSLFAATMALDGPLIARLVELVSPFCSISPTFDVIRVLAQSSLDITRGFFGDARRGYLRALDILVTARNAGMSEAEYSQVRTATLLTVAQISPPSVARDDWIPEIEQNPVYEAGAWRLREYDAISACRLDLADLCGRRAELVALQNTGVGAHQGTTAAAEVMAAARLASLSRLRRAEITTLPFAEQYDGFVPYHRLVRGIRRYLRGDLGGAIEDFEVASRLAPVGAHAQGHFVAIWLVRALVHAKRVDRAAEVAAAAHARATTSGFWQGAETTACVELRLAKALADAAVGETDAAAALEEAMDQIQQLDATLLHRLCAWEYAGLVAIAGGMSSALARCERALDAMVEDTGSSIAQHRLVALRRRRRIIDVAAADAVVDDRTVLLEDGVGQLEMELLSCASGPERCRVALDYLAGGEKDTTGFLFVVTETGVELGASMDDTPPPPALVSEVQQWVRSSRAMDATETLALQTLFGPSGTVLQQESNSYDVIPLCYDAERGMRLTGVAALSHGASEGAVSPPSAVVARIAAALDQPMGTTLHRGGS